MSVHVFYSCIEDKERTIELLLITEKNALLEKLPQPLIFNFSLNSANDVAETYLIFYEEVRKESSCAR